jgi:hypothetical protein
MFPPQGSFVMRAALRTGARQFAFADRPILPFDRHRDAHAAADA